MRAKLNIEFDETNEPVDPVVANALLTQLMVQMVQIGLRTEKETGACDIIKEENEDV